MIHENGFVCKRDHGHCLLGLGNSVVGDIGATWLMPLREKLATQSLVTVPRGSGSLGGT
jgi:hypothetical protein